MTRRLPLLALPAIALFCGSASMAQEVPGKSVDSVIGRTGFLCGWSVIAVADEAARRCHAGEDPGYQAKLAKAVARLETHLAENKGWPREAIARFRAEQIESPFPEQCDGDAGMFYSVMRDMGDATFDALVDQTIVIPGDPQWGDCF